MTLQHITVAIAIVLGVVSNSSAKAWRGIVPLKSTRADVERLLGPSTGEPPRYYLPENTVYVQYAKCRCGDKCKDDDWNVAPDTVILIRVGVKGEVKLADLKLDLSDFQKEPGDNDLPDHFYYVNRKQGLSIEVGRGYVGSYTYGPPAKENHRRCSKPRMKRGVSLSGLFILPDDGGDHVDDLLLLAAWQTGNNFKNLLHFACRSGLAADLH